MELALVALVLRLSAVFDAVALGSAVETLVVPWRRIPFALSFLLLIPREGSNVFFNSWPKPNLRRFNLVDRFAGASFLSCACVHAVCLQVGADFFYGGKRGIIVTGMSACREELVVDARVYIVFQVPNSCAVVSFSVVL